MKSFRNAALAAALALAAFAAPAEAGPLGKLFGRSSCGSGGCRSASRRAEASPAIELPPGIMSVDATIGITIGHERPAQDIAQAKAETQARLGVMHHPGGSFGGGSCEGVGFSTVSADDAIRRCCFWGKRQPLAIGVARGLRGWFAAVLYR